MSAREQVDKLLALINDAAYKALDEYEKHGAEVPTLDSTKVHPLDSELDTVHLKKIIRTLEGACDHLCSALAPPAHTLVNRAQDNYWAALSVAATSHITDILDGHPEGVHARNIAAAINVDEGKVVTILRLLASRHCYREVTLNTFANNRLSMHLHSRLDMASWVELLTVDGQEAALGLPGALRHPEFAHAKNAENSAYMFAMKARGVKESSFYELTQSDAKKQTITSRSMVAMNSVMGTASVVAVYPWDKYKTICDMGGGVGSFSWSLLDKHPNLNVTLFDLPETVGFARKTWVKDQAQYVNAKKISFIGGSFFEEITAKNLDIYYLRNVTHNWPDTVVLTILQNLRRAMAPSSRVLIHEIIMQPLSRKRSTQNNPTDDTQAPSPLLPGFGAGQIRMYNQDMTGMLIYNSKERTADELSDIARRAGLKLEKHWDLGETSVLEFVSY